jgi:L-serine dehydratase
MDINAVSIFNDVLGPIMTGPSSSHTAGPTRIGLLIHNLFEDEISEAAICFDLNGSYPATYKGQGSDIGFIGGLLGFEPFDSRLSNSLKIAKDRGMEYSFTNKDLGAKHPNTAHIRVKSINQKEMNILSYSTGGGTFEIVEIDGFPIDIHGDYYECICIGQDVQDAVVEILRKYQILDETIKLNEKTQSEMIWISQSVQLNQNMISELQAIEKLRVYWSTKIMPIVSYKSLKVPFFTAKEAADYAKEKNIESLMELSYEYEIARSGKSREEIESIAENIYRVMMNSIEAGLRSDFKMRGFLTPKAKIMKENLEVRDYSDLGILNKVMIYTTAVMELNSSRGIVVAAPTAGSCGVIPGILYAMEEHYKYEKEEIIGALMVAGLIGVFISHQATFAAEVGACQAENGSAASMASAAVVQLLGGSIDEGFKAAGMSLQNMLGLICDPVAGLVDIPCINRNASAASNALISANMILAGFEPIIPLDEVIISMKEIGKLLPSELRCTGNGGLCTTPTGIKLAEQFAVSF